MFGIFKKKFVNSNHQKAVELVNAYFEGKDIVMKDPIHGIKDWTSVRHPEYWSYLTEFCKNVDKYKIV